MFRVVNPIPWPSFCLISFEFFNKRMLQGAGGSSISTAYVSAFNGSSFIDPLPLQVAYDPTTSTSIGNINQNTSTWWRNQTKGFTNATTFVKVLAYLRNNCAKGPGGPLDLHLPTQRMMCTGAILQYGFRAWSLARTSLSWARRSC